MATKTAPATTIESKPKPTVWQLKGDADGAKPTVEGEAAKALATFAKNAAEIKKLLTEAGVAKATLKDYAESQWLKAIKATGELPPAPIKLVGEGGVSASFVVKDMSESWKIDDAMFAELGEMLAEHIETRSAFDFNAAVLAQEGTQATVQELVECRLRKMAAAMVEAKEITAEQSFNLITFRTERHFTPGLLAALPEICAGSAARFARVVGKLGGAISRYIQA